MATAFTPGLQIKRSARVRKLRELPARGQVLVKVGDTVAADQVVARAEQPGELRILRVSETLGIEPFEVIKGLKIRAGERVQKDQAICVHAGLFGLFKSVYRSPEEGIAEFITESTGHIAIRQAPTTLSLRAYINGRVCAIEEGKSVSIETQAMFVQGIFGVGGERLGVIRNLALRPDEQLTAAAIPADVQGAILVGGTRPDLAALRKAADGGAVGLVVGAIDDMALAGYLGYDLGIALTGDEEVEMTVIVTEGFGQIPIAERVVKLLRDCEGRQASINGATQVRAGALRPEIIVSETEGSVAVNQELPKGGVGGLTVGSRVRIIRVPYFGAEATVIELPPDARRIETGADARILQAKLTTGETVTVPRANVELL